MPYTLAQADTHQSRDAYEYLADALDKATADLKREPYVGDAVYIVRAIAKMKAGRRIVDPERYLKTPPVYFVSPDPVKYVTRRDARWAAAAMIARDLSSVFYVCEIVASVGVKLTTRVY
jgi:hypothetical protein